VNEMLRKQHQSNDAVNISFNEGILKSLKIDFEEDPRAFRTPSPVKIITHLLSGTGSIGRATPTRTQPVKLENVPVMKPLEPKKTLEPKPSIQTITNPSPQIITTKNSEEEDMSPSQLEAILERYLNALSSCQGRYTSHVLSNRQAPALEDVKDARKAIEDLSVTTAIEQPELQVLFAAFDSFLHVTWQQPMGPIVPAAMWINIQENSEVMPKADFVEFFRTCMTELTPQNRRAFMSIVAILSDLLKASSNDADRGALTAIFAGFLITDLDSRRYIPLLDHVESHMTTLFSGMLLFLI
jgi:hypothetical protein